MNARPAARLSARELAAAEGAALPAVLDPLLPAGDVALVYGPSGVGKSLLALGIACAAAAGSSFLGWRAPRPHRVLYVDGKATAGHLQRRLALFGPPPASLDFWLASRDDGPILDLSQGAGQERLVAGWGQPELVVLDDLSSLAGLRSGDPDRWPELQRFLQLQRSLGRAVLMVHHANSRGTLRGGSRREDVIDLVLALRPPPAWTAAQGARFEIHVEKARNVHGAALQPILATLHAEPESRCGAPRWDAQPVPGDRTRQGGDAARRRTGRRSDGPHARCLARHRLSPAAARAPARPAEPTGDDDMSDDDKTDGDKTGDDKAGDDRAGDDKAGDDKAGEATVTVLALAPRPALSPEQEEIEMERVCARAGRNGDIYGIQVWNYLREQRRRRIALDLPPLENRGDVEKAQFAVAAAAMRGEATPRDALYLSTILENCRRALATQELEGRLRALEKLNAERAAKGSRR